MDCIQNIEEFTSTVPFPMCVVTEEGKIESANNEIGEVFIYDGIVGSDVFQITGIKKEVLYDIENEKNLKISRSEKVFSIVRKIIRHNDLSYLMLCFIDITDKEKIEEKYKEEQVCSAIINIDNYDELTADMGEENQLYIRTEIDGIVRNWAQKMNASITKYKSNAYLVIFENIYLEKEKEVKFSILDEVRDIESDLDYPITLSIGIGVEGKYLSDKDKFATEALDLALGRGGDQVVIKSKDKISYYGGKAQTVEKRNKGKSRLIGHALKRLIENSSKIFIMGHKNPDMDAFGAAIGIASLAMPINKESYIVVEKYNEALESLYLRTKKTEKYNLINNKKAISLIDDESLVIVVDTHRPSLTECPELLELGEKHVVIDHHRKAEESIENATLVYTEPYASSTAELVTEILQYTMDKKAVTKLEAEALLAGMFVDTNRFSVKTGVRTFEAAAWLRRAGADIADVRVLFQVGKETFLTRAKCIANAHFDEKGRAFSVSEGRQTNAQIINSQVADELLTIKGMNMSFVAGCDESGQTVVSARSIGEKNVQIIMEKFNGGGHMNTAGAQVDISPEEAIAKIKELLEETEE